MGDEDQSVAFGRGECLLGDGLRGLFEALVVIPEFLKTRALISKD
jgi:hypothetical protein